MTGDSAMGVEEARLSSMESSIQELQAQSCKFSDWFQECGDLTPPGSEAGCTDGVLDSRVTLADQRASTSGQIAWGSLGCICGYPDGAIGKPTLH